MKKFGRTGAAAATIALIIMAASCTQAPSNTTSTTGTATTGAASVENGRNIFLYATSSSGDPLYQSSGPGMMYYSCASCHGQNAHGGQIFLMMAVYDVPNITWAALTGPDPDMDHPPYTVDTFKRAVTQGLDPGGNRLEYPMPVWVISDRDLNDVIAFLQSLT
ncbi:hypothetical protein Dform_00015 [Dehalogenimonas formicexedens]|uniref:Cytochrome c domain-containing protein n=1 Tax=Dehalogenimonas formicexedens TaxID=1839801 RepID=A0A1P8F4I8_9CHLR|nr:c-type cytochrome [Dehalogenimonas formicexedens]APV43381.1 hypothetical protein Dform_00015 [Dehalogenimonas formicexedens]